MKYTDVKTCIVSTLRKNLKQATTLAGPPGVAKSACARDIVREIYPDLPEDRVLELHVPTAEPSDFRGLPDINAGEPFTVWRPAEEIYRFRKGTGPGAIIYDDRGQATVQVKNVIARLLLDRKLDSVVLDDQVIQISTTNRTEDKAGSNRDPSQLSNREAGYEMEAHLDDWCAWALTNDIDPLLIAFVRLRPNLLHDFDPNRPRNPTPRSLEMVSRSCDPALPRGLYMQQVAALCGEGFAAEYVGTRDLMSKMPNIDGILMAPDKAEVPTEPAVQYAVVTALAMRASKDNFDRIMKYADRMPLEMSTVLVKDAIMRDKAVMGSKAFTQWATTNASVFV